MQPKNLIILILSAAIIVLVYIAFKPSKDYQPAYKLLKQVYDSLNVDYKKTQKQIIQIENEKQKLKGQVDSLSKLEPLIKTIYVKKYKEIDNSSVFDGVRDFDSIFSNNNIKLHW